MSTASTGLARRAANTVRVAVAVPGERRAPYRPARRLAAVRDARVRELVRYAAEHVPFYRDHFAASGLDPAGFRSAEDLERLPLVDKETVREAPERFRSLAPEAHDAVELETSGSTGVPVQIAHDRRSVLLNMAWGERERVVVARVVGKGLRAVTLSVGFGQTSPGAHVRALYRGATLVPGQRRVRLDLTEPFERVVEVVNELRPDVIRSCGSFLEQFFRRLLSSGTPLHRPRAVVYAMDAMSPAGRRLIEDEAGVPVLSSYNATESLKIGFLCEARAALHLHSDLCHVRIADAAGRTLPPGEVGEVVLSNLVNRATVLLNYRLGDLAAAVDGPPCPCGRSLPGLTLPQGRVRNVLSLPGGGFVNEGAVWIVSERFPDVVALQVAQLAPLRFEARIVTAGPAAHDRVAPLVVDELRALLGEGAEIVPVATEALEAGPRGKTSHVVPLAAP